MSALAEIGLVDQIIKPHKYSSWHDSFYQTQNITDGKPLSNTSIMFDCSTEKNLIDLSESYFTGCFQLQNSVNALPYPSGTAIALNPCWFACWASNFQISYGGSTIEQQSQNIDITTFISELTTRSNDYYLASRGYNEGFILDEPGETQFNQTGAANILPAVISDVFTGYTVYFEVGTPLAPYNPPLLLNATRLLAFTPPVGVIVPAGTELTILGPDGSAVNIQAGIPSQTGAAVNPCVSVKFTSIAVGTNNHCAINAAFPAVGTTIAANSNLTLFSTQKTHDVYTQLTTGNVLLTLQNSTAIPAAGIVSTIVAVAGAPNNAAFPAAGGSLLGSLVPQAYKTNNQSGFWKRQALTDNGNWFVFKIPFKNFFSCFFRNNPPLLFGGKLTISWSVSSDSIAKMVQHGTGVAAPSIIAKGIRMGIRIPHFDGDTPIFKSLSSFLQSGNKSYFEWFLLLSQNVGTIPATSNVFSQNIKLENQNVEKLIIVFIPSSYTQSTSGTVNTMCSLVPSGGSTNYNNPITNGFVTYLSENIPYNNYGTQNFDLQREYEALVNLSGRNNSEDFGPVFDLKSFLANYFYLVFDLSQVDRSKLSNTATTVALNLAFQNVFTTQTNVYCVSQVKKTTEIQGINNTMLVRTL